MSAADIVVCGIGAVSPAGWGAGPLVAAVRGGVPPSPSDIIRRHGEVEVRTPVRRVPEAAHAAVLPKHPRLRRASPLSRFAAAAAWEALGAGRAARVAKGELRLGIVCTLMNGCVNYSNRFYGEVLADPSLASPILFPETVFNAPSSHLSALFGAVGPNDTLIGDGAEFATAVEVAAGWLVRGEVDTCLVVSTEEIDWLSAEGLVLYGRGLIAAEGAGALCLERFGAAREIAGDGPEDAGRREVVLAAVPGPEGLRGPGGREGGLRRLREACGVADDGATLLVDGITGGGRDDAVERAVWADWGGPRVSPRTVLGEGMGASMAWQTVVAVAAIQRREARRAVVAALGGNEQAAAVVLEDGRG